MVVMQRFLPRAVSCAARETLFRVRVIEATFGRAGVPTDQLDRVPVCAREDELERVSDGHR